MFLSTRRRARRSAAWRRLAPQAAWRHGNIIDAKMRRPTGKARRNDNEEWANEDKCSTWCGQPTTSNVGVAAMTINGDQTINSMAATRRGDGDLR